MHRSIQLAMVTQDLEEVSSIISSFFERLSRARDLVDINIAAGVAMQELENLVPGKSRASLEMAS